MKVPVFGIRIHIPSTEVIQSSSAIKLLTTVAIIVNCVACWICQIAKSVIIISISNRAIFVRKLSYWTMPVIKIVRNLSVTFLWNKVCTSGVICLFCFVSIKLSKNLCQRWICVKNILYKVKSAVCCRRLACAVSCKIVGVFPKDIITTLF